MSVEQQGRHIDAFQRRFRYLTPGRGAGLPPSAAARSMFPRFRVLCKAAMLPLALGLEAAAVVSAGELTGSGGGVAFAEEEPAAVAFAGGAEAGGGVGGAAFGVPAAFGVGGEGDTSCSALSRASRSFTLMPPEAAASGLDVCVATVFGLPSLPAAATGWGAGWGKSGDVPFDAALKLAILAFTLGVPAASLPSLLSWEAAGAAAVSTVRFCFAGFAVAAADASRLARRLFTLETGASAGGASLAALGDGAGCAGAAAPVGWAAPEKAAMRDCTELGEVGLPPLSACAPPAAEPSADGFAGAAAAGFFSAAAAFRPPDLAAAVALLSAAAAAAGCCSNILILSLMELIVARQPVSTQRRGPPSAQERPKNVELSFARPLGGCRGNQELHAS